MERCIPIWQVENFLTCKETLNALVAFGFSSLEITFRTPHAAKGIAYAREHYPTLSVGAGTILSREQATEALNAGAEFLVSPGLSAEVAEIAHTAGVPYYPGAVTASEVMEALALGIATVKFFPCTANGGLSAVKMLAAPFPMVKFLVTGGIDKDNYQSYLAEDFIAGVGGSCFVKMALEGASI